MMTLDGIMVYPVKSLRGIPRERARITGGRLEGDREWLVADREGRFMHQRDYPQMATLRAEPGSGGITIEAPGRSRLEVQRPAGGVAIEYLRLWRRLAPVRPAGPDADDWITAALGVPARLLAFAADAQPLEAPSWEMDASLQDATPFHLTSRDSLDDLNRRMGAPLPMNRFRPNLVVRGAPPYQEDDWRRIRIGEARFRWIKPCTRCKMTMTDQETGERPSLEPLRTLATYRRLGPEVTFGHYLAAETPSALLHVGQEVSVLAALSKTDPALS